MENGAAIGGIFAEESISISLIVKIFEYQNIWVSKEKQRIDFQIP